MIVIVCPGQGSQKPGFLKPWLSDPFFAEHLEKMADGCGIDLAQHGTVSDADTIRDTAVAQPLLVAAGLLVLRPLLEAFRASTKNLGIAGHSVGEITAAVGAGILTEEDALVFVRERGKAMANAAGLSSTGMSAVIGAEENELHARLNECGLYAANFNGAGQIVVAGTRDALAALRSAPPQGARVIPLQVAGAFHTPYMKSALLALTETAAHITPHDPSLTIWTNKDGSHISQGQEFLDLLVAQVCSPVHWDECMNSFAKADVTGTIELLPGGALTGLIKRTFPDLPTVALTTPNDLPAAYELINA